MFKNFLITAFSLFVLVGCSENKVKNVQQLSVEERLKNQTAPFLEKSIGVWEAKDSINYALVDSVDFYLFKVIYPNYVFTDTVNVKQLDGETFIYHQNPIGKEHYKINILDQLVYFDDLGKPHHTYQSLK